MITDHPPGKLHDGTPATDGKCVQHSLKKAVELVFSPAHAKLITVPALGKMLPFDLTEKIPTGYTKSDGSPWRLGDCGSAGESWSENCTLLLLKATLGANAFEYTKLKELSGLVPNNEADDVYLVNVDLFPQSGGLIDDAEDDGDNNHMVLMRPANNEVYCSYYYFPKMTKASSKLPENALYTNELVPRLARAPPPPSAQRDLRPDRTSSSAQCDHFSAPYVGSDEVMYVVIHVCFFDLRTRSSLALAPP